MVGIGNILRQIRKEKNITQEKLAEILNTNRVRISNIENEKTDMTFNEAIILCNELNIAIERFLDVQNLSSVDYIKISNRYIKNENLSEAERRDVLKKIHIDFEIDCFNKVSLNNVINNDKNTQKLKKCNKLVIDKFLIK